MNLSHETESIHGTGMGDESYDELNNSLAFFFNDSLEKDESHKKIICSPSRSCDNLSQDTWSFPMSEDTNHKR